jgi:hypothetical protein
LNQFPLITDLSNRYLENRIQLRNTYYSNTQLSSVLLYECKALKQNANVRMATRLSEHEMRFGLGSGRTRSGRTSLARRSSHHVPLDHESQRDQHCASREDLNRPRGDEVLLAGAARLVVVGHRVAHLVQQVRHNLVQRPSLQNRRHRFQLHVVEALRESRIT